MKRRERVRQFLEIFDLFGVNGYWPSLPYIAPYSGENRIFVGFLDQDAWVGRLQLCADSLDHTDDISVCYRFLPVKIDVRSSWKSAEGVGVPMVGRLPILDDIIILAQHKRPSSEPICCKTWCRFRRSKKRDEWLVICDEDEVSPVQELMEFLQCKNNCQGFLVNLAIAALSLYQGLGRVGNWAFTAVRVTVEKYSPNSNFGSVARNANLK